MLDIPLKNTKVIDFGCYYAGPLAGMLLADQGAEVIAIEPIDGPIFKHPANTILGRNKSHLRLNLKEASDLQSVKRLIQSSDILIENFSPGVMQNLGLGVDDALALNPNLVYISLPGFSDETLLEKGQKAFEGVIAAAMGHYTDVHAIRQTFGLDPVFTGLPLSSVYAGVHAAAAAVMALREIKQGRKVGHIKVPLDAASLSAMTSMFLKVSHEPQRFKTPRLPSMVKHLALPILKAWAKTGTFAQQKILDIARNAYPALMNSYACMDGRLLYIFAIDNVKLAEKTLRTLNLYDELIREGLTVQDPYSCGDLTDNLAETSNLSRSWQTKIKQKIANVLMQQPAAFWEYKLRENGVACAIQRTTKEWLSLKELKEANIIVNVADNQGGLTPQPGLQTWLSETKESLMQPSPAKLISLKDIVDHEKNSLTLLRDADSPANWLKGITVIDMSSMVAGPVSARSLAEYGAEVIKVDTPRPNHGPRMTCWYGMDVNQGKRSLLIDLKSNEGQIVINKLLNRADILITNQPESAMAALNLSEVRIRRDYPELIYSRLGAYNGPKTGAWSNDNGYDPVLQAASGIMVRYGDTAKPELHAIASCVDALTGYSAMFGTALALYRKERLGGGCTVNTSLSAAATLIQLPYCHAKEGSLNEVNGQFLKGTHSLYRLYKTKNSWIFVAGKLNQLDAVLARFSIKVNRTASAEALLEERLRAISTSACIEKLNGIGVTAVQVENIENLRVKFIGNNEGKALFINKHYSAELGHVYFAPAQQVQFLKGSLRNLGLAEKVGNSSNDILEALGFDSKSLFNTGIAAKELSNEYLPS
jgi:crotonobetainyl-CoA:carnitine CoA-transferase CaiB-like acyl-CoA transferase